MKKHLHILSALLLIGAAAPALAQTSYGTVAGTVTDPTGAAVANAVVTLHSRDSGETRVTKTSASGGYHVESLGTGHWDVTAEATGFARTVVSNVEVPPSVTTSVNEVLSLGAASETVEVSAGKEVVQTESGEISDNITGKEISELPISSLNPANLIGTLPGVTAVTVGSSGNGPNYSVNGSRPRANNFLIEGQDDNDAGLTGMALKPQNTESFDNVSFLLNGYSAEFGYAGGGVTNIVFKSGTNHWHGSVYDRLLNSSLNAIDHNNKYNGLLTKTKFRENIYGFSVGGPILHDRLFIFGAYQQDHYRSSQILSILTVPTAAGYTVLNTLASNPRVANLIKAYGGLVGADPPGTGNNPTGKYAAYSKAVALGPDPVTGVDRGTVQYGGVQRVIGRPSNASELDLKSDWQATQADKVQFRFIRSYSLVPYDTGNFPAQLPLFDTNQGGPSENAGIVYTRIFSPNLLNELRVSYSRIDFKFDLRPDTYSNPLALGPSVAISGVQGYGIPTNVPQGRGHNTYQLQDAVSWTHGKHSMKFGFDVNQIRVKDEVPFIFYGSISYVASSGVGTTPAYTALANYIDDYSGYTSSTGQSLTQNFGSNVARPTLTNQNYYVQDHWKVSPRLALDYGLRYEYQGAPFNYLAFPATDVANPTGSFATRVAQNPKFDNFGPRVGFAYQPFDEGKFVIRGAFGMFYDHTFSNIEDNVQAAAPNAASPVLYGSNATGPRGTANWSQQFATLSKTPLPTNTQTTLSNNLVAPLTYQYNLEMQKELPAGFSLTLGYAGSRGLHLYALDTLNPIIPTTGVRKFSNRGSITFFDNAGDSDYNSLQVTLEHKLRHSIEFLAAFTYSKSLDNVSDPYTSGNLSAYPQIQPALGVLNARGYEWANSAYDHRLRAVGTIIYQTPSFKGSGLRGVVGHIISNYTVSTIPSFQSGSVYNVQVGFDVNNDGITNDRPVLENPNAPFNSFAVDSLTFYSAAKGGAAGVFCDGTYINNAYSKNPVTGLNDAYCHPVSLSQVHWYSGAYTQQNPTIGRNVGITPGTWNADAAVQRIFKMGERQAVSFRAEAFNVLNHANTSGAPSFTLYSSADQPVAAGYNPGTFNNYPSVQVGARNLRFFLRYSF